MPPPDPGRRTKQYGFVREVNHASQARYLTFRRFTQTSLFVAPPGDASSIGRAPGFYPEGSGFDSLASHVCRALHVEERDLGSVA